MPEPGCARVHTRTPLTCSGKRADNYFRGGFPGIGFHSVKMNGSKVSLVLAVLCFIVVSPDMARTYFDPPLPEESTFFEEMIPLEFKEKGGQEISFDIRDDIKRGQEFLSDKIAGHALVKEEKRKILFRQEGQKKRKGRIRKNHQAKFSSGC